MKIRIVFLLMVLIAGMMLQSCDKISAPYATLKKSSDDTTAENVRKVLLEDYTDRKSVV